LQTLISPQYSGSYDRTIKVWDIENSSNLFTIPCVSSCNYVHLSPDGSMIGSAHLDSHVRFWSYNSRELIYDGEEHKKTVSCVKFPSTGPLCLTTSKDCSLKVIDTRTWGVVRTLTDGEYKDVGTWSQFAISPDGAFVAAGSGSGAVIIWEVESGKRKKYLRGHSGAVTSCAWSPYGVSVVSTDKTGVINVWS
jgi:autophagy-related protein 16